MVVGLGHVGRALLRSWGRIRGDVKLVAALDSRGRFEDEKGLDPDAVVRRKLDAAYDLPVEGPAAGRIRAIRPDILIELSVTMPSGFAEVSRSMFPSRASSWARLQGYENTLPTCWTGWYHSRFAPPTLSCRLTVGPENITSSGTRSDGAHVGSSAGHTDWPMTG